MKKIIFILLLFTAPYLSAQYYGALHVKSFTNTTNNLSDNQEEDSTLVRIINSKYAIDTTIYIQKEFKNRIHLKEGKYNLACSSGSQTIELNDVQITGDRILFIEILFEPDIPLSKKEIRKRRKLFSNYQ